MWIGFYSYCAHNRSLHQVFISNNQAHYTMKVSDMMNSDVITCVPTDKIREVAAMLKEHNISGIVVVENSGSDSIVGIVTESDVLKLLELPEPHNLWLPSPLEIIEIPIRELLGWEDAKASLEDIGSKPISTIMTSKVRTIAADDTIEHASTLMIKHRVNRLPVVNDAGKLVGILTRGDIIQAVAGAGI